MDISLNIKFIISDVGADCHRDLIEKMGIRKWEHRKWRQAPFSLLI
jgi:hypothetical protein